MDYYDTLGVSKNASDKELKSAFKKKAMQYHPDKGGDPEQFKQTATFWTETYARPPGDESDSQAVTKLMEMGFGRDACVKALQDANGDETEAINALLSG